METKIAELLRIVRIFASGKVSGMEDVVRYQIDGELRADNMRCRCCHKKAPEWQMIEHKDDCDVRKAQEILSDFAGTPDLKPGDERLSNLQESSSKEMLHRIIELAALDCERVFWAKGSGEYRARFCFSDAIEARLGPLLEAGQDAADDVPYAKSKWDAALKKASQP